MGEIVEKNEVEVDLDIVKRIKQRILREEDWNQRTKDKTSIEMIELHKKIVEEEINAY